MRIQKYSSGCLLSALITVLAAGCADTDVLSGGKERIEITAETAPCSQAGSRSQIDEAGSTAGVTGILWSVDDQIGVFGKSTVNAPFEGTHTEPAATATFTGEVTSGDTPLHAYYPYREDATDAAAIPVTVAVEQYWTGAASISDNDIKASSTVTRRGDSWHFAFRPMVAMLRFEVDASGVDGVSTDERLVSIHVEEPEESDGKAEPWAGEFTMNLTDLDAGLAPVDGEAVTGLAVNLTDEPALTGKVKAYACIAPVIRSGQVLQIHLATDKHRISFRVTARQDLAAGGCYDIPLHLAAATVEENGLTIEDITAGEEPEILSFGFEAARNKGKILAREAYYDGSKTTVRSVTGQELTVTTEEGNPQGEISGCIPYLYDFTLVPTFTVTEGATVTVDGAEQTSGVSAQDFRSPVTYTVTAGGMSRDYVVTVTNTGLPVVVMTGNSGGSVQFLDMTVPAKKFISCIYRIREASGVCFGAQHVIDVLMGNMTDRVARFSHDKLSTWSIGQDLSAAEWRILLRQLVARHVVWVDPTARNALSLGEAARDLLRGNMKISVRKRVAETRRKRREHSQTEALLQEFSKRDRSLYEALRQWRSDEAKSLGKPPYVIFKDATLLEIVRERPTSPEALRRISGVGEKKLVNYGDAVLDIVAAES